ncbi:MAG: TSUP family transporter [Bdellovibrionota bacterium]
MSVPTLLALGLPADRVIASNKMIGVSTALAGTYKYIKSKIIVWEGLPKLIVFAFAGSILGSYTNSLMSPEFLRVFIFFTILSLFLYLTFKKEIEFKNLPISRYAPIFFPIIITALGFYDGFFGPGTGTFLIMALLYFQRFSLLQAGATGRVLNLTSNLASILYFSTTGLIDITFVLPAMFSSFIGGYCGASYSVRYGSRGIRPLLYFSVTGLLLKLGYDLFLS